MTFTNQAMVIKIAISLVRAINKKLKNDLQEDVSVRGAKRIVVKD